MPVTIKNAAIKYKDPATGEYKSVDAISDGTTAERIAAITEKGAETLASIPDDYSSIYDAVFSKESKTTWELGNYNANSGNKSTSSIMTRLTEYVGISLGIYTFSAPSNYLFAVFAWNKETGSYVGCLRTSGNISTSGTIKYINGEYGFSFEDYPNYLFRVSVCKSGDVTLTEEERANVKFHVSNFTTDTTLSAQGKPADSKTVGDRISGINAYVDLTRKYAPGYIQTNGSIGSVVDISTISASGGYAYVMVPCEPGDKFIITGHGADKPRLWCFVDETYHIVSQSASSAIASEITVTCGTKGYFISDANISYKYKLLYVPAHSIVGSVIETLTARSAPKSLTVVGIAHRGDDTIAPQCTAPAYIMAKKRGFDVGENDLALSNDNEYVMWHDETLSRLGTYLVDISGYDMYSDGSDFYYYDSENKKLYTYENEEYVESETALSGLTQCVSANYGVASLNLDVLKRIDFGKYKGEKFAGTQILTFEDWVCLCKQIGMEIVVDKKINITDAIASDLVSIVRKYGMLDHTAWLSGTQTSSIRTYDPNAKCGTIYAPSSENVETYASYKSGRGFFFQPNAENATAEMANLALSNGYGFGVYYVDFGNEPPQSVLNLIKTCISFGAQMVTIDHYHPEDAFADMFDAY